MKEALNEVGRILLVELYKHHNDENNDKNLEKAKNIAGDIQFRLATAFLQINENLRTANERIDD